MKQLSILFLLLCFGVSCKEMPPDDPEVDPVKVSISNVTQFEGDDVTTFDFAVNLSKLPTEPVSVSFTTLDKTAGESIDYIAKSGTIDFSTSDLSQIISIAIVTDTLKEPDEAFEVELLNPVGLTLIQSIGTGTIRNDDDFIFIPDDGYITPESYTGFDLSWGDEFDGDDLDPNCYNYEIGDHGWGNNELQYYTNNSKNSYIADGKMVIEAIEEDFQGADYTSARITTQGKKEFLFGRIDVRAQLPKGQGVWPAIWMLGANFGDIGWPACGEIDIMELLGHQPSRSHGTAHWGPQGQSWSHNHSGHTDLDEGTFEDKFHVFSIIWEYNSIKWYVDDELFHQIDENTVGNEEYRFNQEFFFIFNVAVGGNWPGNPDASTEFPVKMYVDYIRVFQKQ